MTDKYNQWIYKHYPTSVSAYRACEEATKLMAQQFPELKRIRGMIDVEEPYDLPPTRVPHWWLETEHSDIVDPTAHQYPTKILKYIPWDESKGEPTGKCPNCGDFCFNNKTCCSDKCSKEYIQYLNGC